MNEPDRLTLLEERYAHLQRHSTEQDRAMLELGEEMVKLRQELAVLRAQVAADPAGGSGPGAEERPPHY